jgi:hypothetical protein
VDLGKPQRTIVVEPVEEPVPGGGAQTAAAPDLIEPVAGWRLWTVVRRRDGLCLSSVARDALWPAGRSLEACCQLHGHAAPHGGCACGIHALRRPGELFRCLGWIVAPPTPYVVGLVDLWGRVVECERGWRAERAYPRSLAVVASGRDERAVREVAAGLAAYGCALEIVHGGVPAVLAGLDRGAERVAAPALRSAR